MNPHEVLDLLYNFMTDNRESLMAQYEQNKVEQTMPYELYCVAVFGSLIEANMEYKFKLN